VERDLAAVRRLLDDTIHGAFPIRELRAAIPAPPDVPCYARALGAPIHFGARRTQILFAPRWRELAMPYGNPLLEETYERQCQELLAALSVQSSEVERVVDLLVRCKGRWPSIQETSAQIAVSPRTLRRRLEEKGVSYRALVEEVRRKQAEELLGRTRLTVEQIADSLGYAETASFTHAFKRWTGRAPREFRRAPG
jgi:AraC-like DNA-binding protein